MKQKEIKILSDDELKDKLNSIIVNLYNIKSTHAVSPLENPLEIRNLKRTIARLKTEISKDLKSKYGKKKFKKRKNWSCYK